MILQLLTIGAFIAFFAGAMNGLSKLGTRGISTAAAQWLGIALIASAAFAAESHTLLLAGGIAGAAWLVWKSAPVSGLGSMIGALAAAMSAPAHDVLGTRLIGTGAVVTTLGMGAIVVGVVLSPAKRGNIALRKAEHLVRTALGVVKERGFQLRILSDVKNGFAELGQRKVARPAKASTKVAEAANEPLTEVPVKAQQELLPEPEAFLGEQAVQVSPEKPKKSRTARFAGRQKRQKRDDADQAMLERLSGARPSPQKAETEADERPRENTDVAGDDAAFEEIVKMLRSEG